MLNSLWCTQTLLHKSPLQQCSHDVNRFRLSPLLPTTGIPNSSVVVDACVPEVSGVVVRDDVGGFVVCVGFGSFVVCVGGGDCFVVSIRFVVLYVDVDGLDVGDDVGVLVDVITLDVPVFVINFGVVE